MNAEISRRQFLATTALAGTILPGALNCALASGDAPTAVTAAKPAIPIIDSHIHLYDPSRPQGVPWPSPDNKVLYQTTLPARYRPIAQPLGIAGAIAVECSDWIADNKWWLDVAAKDEIMVGVVGRLMPGTPDFRSQLDRHRKNPLFRGIRYWLGQSGKGLSREVIADLQYMADADLVMDTANPSVSLLADVVRVSDLVPNLRIVVDHLPQMVPPPAASAERASYDASMKAFRDRPQIYVKVSEVLRHVEGKIPTDLRYYRPRLDEILEVFGVDRVIYGSDWPNSDSWLPTPVAFKLVQEYFNGLGRPAAEKYFWRNSLKCYNWVKRTASQPH